MFDRLVVWDGNSLIKVGYFAPQVIPSGIVNRGIQRTGNKKKDPERGRKLLTLSCVAIDSNHIKEKTPKGDENWSPFPLAMRMSLYIKINTPQGDGSIIQKTSFSN